MDSLFFRNFYLQEKFEALSEEDKEELRKFRDIVVEQLQLFHKSLLFSSNRR